MKSTAWLGLAMIAGFLSVSARVHSQDADPVARGKVALTTRPYTPPSWTMTGYLNAWKHWQPPLKEAPADYDAALRDYYGMHAPPYENGRLPMGLREADFVLGLKGLTNDCMLCHAGSILGK